MCKKTEIEDEIRSLNKKLSKAKTAAKNDGVDHMRYQPYLNLFDIIKKKKKELIQMDLKMYKAVEEKMKKNNFNGRTQYVKGY